MVQPLTYQASSSSGLSLRARSTSTAPPSMSSPRTEIAWAALVRVSALSVAQIRSGARKRHALGAVARAIAQPAVGLLLHVAIRTHRVGRGELAIGRYRLAKQPQRPVDARLGPLPQAPHGRKCQRISIGLADRFRFQPLWLVRLKLRHDAADKAGRDPVLEFERRFAATVVAIGPSQSLGGSIRQLRADADMAPLAAE